MTLHDLDMQIAAEWGGVRRIAREICACAIGAGFGYITAFNVYGAAQRGDVRTINMIIITSDDVRHRGASLSERLTDLLILTDYLSS